MSKQGFNKAAVENGEPILQVAMLIDKTIAVQQEQLEFLKDQQEAQQEERWGVSRLEQALAGVHKERKQMQRHLSQGNEDEAIASMKRLLRKVIRVQRRF